MHGFSRYYLQNNFPANIPAGAVCVKVQGIGTEDIRAQEKSEFRIENVELVEHSFSVPRKTGTSKDVSPTPINLKRVFFLMVICDLSC